MGWLPAYISTAECLKGANLLLQKGQGSEWAKRKAKQDAT
jgi:hypothetical protein